MHRRPAGLLFRRTVRWVLTLVVLGVVVVRWVRADDREARRRDRAADRVSATGEGVDELGAYNAYLASLNAGDPRG